MPSSDWRAEDVGGLVSVLRATVCSGFSNSRGTINLGPVVWLHAVLWLHAVIWLRVVIWLRGAQELGRECLLHQLLRHRFPNTTRVRE